MRASGTVSGQKAGPTPLHEHTSQMTSILNPLASERVSVCANPHVRTFYLIMHTSGISKSHVL